MEKISLIEEKFKSLFRFAIFLLFVIPISLITGPLLPEIFSFLLIIIFFFLIFKEKKYYIFKKYNFNIFILFYLYLVILSIFSESIFLSLKSSLFYFRFGFFYLAICYFLENMNINYKKYIYALFFLSFFIFFDALFQTITGFNVFNQKLIHSSRASSLFGDELIMGSYVIRMLPIIVSLIYFFEIKKLINLIPILWLTSILTVLLSGEKNSLGLIIILSVIYFLFSNFSFAKKTTALLLTVLLSILLVNSFPQIKKRIFTQAKQISQNGEYGFSRMHYSHYKTSYLMFIDKPIFGHGPKSFRVQCKKDKFNYDVYSCSTHPHNMYLQLLSETGFVGFLFILSLWVYSFFRLLTLFFQINKYDYKNQFNIFATATIFINLFPISTSGNIFNNWISYIYFLSLALFLYSLKNNDIKYD